MDSIGWLQDDLDWVEVPGGVPDPRKAKVTVFLLGPLRMFRNGQPIRGGWRMKSLELLAFLGVHPHGASKDQILEALWPEGDPRQTQKYLWRTVSDLRCRLRGPSAMQVIAKIDDSYVLDLDDVWTDAIAFEQAARRAALERSPEAVLRFACALYKGEFCEGRYFGWDTLTRERLNRSYIEAARTLSDRREVANDLEGALAVLESAIEIDPYDEDLCRRAMRLDAEMGRADRAARRWKRVRRLCLDGLGIEPSIKTMHVLDAVFGGDLARVPPLVRPSLDTRQPPGYSDPLDQGHEPGGDSSGTR